MMKRKQQGFSLVELVAFIVVMGIVSIAIFVPLQLATAKAPSTTRQAIATGLAQGRMELILGQRRLLGFNNFSDPCTGSSPPSICTSLSGYTVSSTITTTATGKTITVIVSGLGDATLTLNVGNY